MYTKEQKEKLKYFIDNNNINLTAIGSGFNGNAVILIGYSLYLGITHCDTIIDILREFGIRPSENMEHTFDFAQRKNYGDWWKDKNNRNRFRTLD